MTTFTNGNIFTGQDATSFVSAMTLENGRVTWVGDAADVTDDQAIDLHQQTVLPGLLDAHTHPKYIADALHGGACTPPHINSIADMQAALRQSPEFGKGANVWLEGWGFDETKLAEHRTPTVDDLDAITTEQPIFIYRSDCHSSIGNSKALELAGITAETPDPKGGEIGHFPDGRPNGYMKEVAASQLLIRAKSAQNYEADVTNMVNTSTHYLENGLVAIGELMGRKQPYDTLDLYEDAMKRGFEPQSAIYYVWSEIKDLKDPIGTPDNDKLSIAGVKVFMDGSISGETAWNKVPYPSGKNGVQLTTGEELLAAVTFARDHHLQAAVHAMGDAAIQLILDTTQDLTPWLEHGPSIRIEHATLLSDEMLAQIKAAKMNYALVTQPIFYFAEDESYRTYLNDDQFKNAYRIKSMIATTRTALSSDAPCTPWFEPDSPFIAMQAAVNRTAVNGDVVNLDEAISIGEAVLGYTKWGAEVGGLTDSGQLQPGFRADFVILNQDLFSVPADQIGQTKVLSTWIGAKKVYER
ncbi:amidohydrolase [Secundilactobacillus similis DSM 23365 = JCM 2765]|uniref:Amidohydrolase 3 n=1 Tax=Secundilactobacillus similis DSM 23365 = JCM 2765 TaxID=1423804 RepID=A0A0R2EVH5_9LACO|nr:amidohydrolase [Secundilactobacillus similis]KRN19907.1 amidohydrolase 3 [Secundilactobacillus similis DSM 23365 = JCM 2765]